MNARSEQGGGICSLGMEGKALTDRACISYPMEALGLEQGSMRYMRIHGNFLREQSLCPERKSSL